MSKETNMERIYLIVGIVLGILIGITLCWSFNICFTEKEWGNAILTESNESMDEGEVPFLWMYSNLINMSLNEINGMSTLSSIQWNLPNFSEVAYYNITLMEESKFIFLECVNSTLKINNTAIYCERNNGANNE